MRPSSIVESSHFITCDQQQANFTAYQIASNVRWRELSVIRLWLPRTVALSRLPWWLGVRVYLLLPQSPRQGIKDSMMPREHLKSPLKPQPTPLVLEHHLEAVPRSR